MDGKIIINVKDVHSTFISDIFFNSDKHFYQLLTNVKMFAGYAGMTA